MEQIAALLLAPERLAKLSLRPEVAAELQPVNPCQAIHSQPEGSQRDLPLTPHAGQLPGSQCHWERVASLHVLLSFWLKYAPPCFGDASQAMGKWTLVMRFFSCCCCWLQKIKVLLKDKQVLKCWQGTCKAHWMNAENVQYYFFNQITVFSSALSYLLTADFCITWRNARSQTLAEERPQVLVHILAPMSSCWQSHRCESAFWVQATDTEIMQRGAI